jgi:hypothetical protein
MAKQAGKYRFIGTVDDLCFYKMDGVHYVRMKSSLNGKKFWRDKAFEGARKSCKRFGEGNRLASKVYQMIEEEKRVYKLFCFLKTRAILLLKEEKNLQKAEDILIEYLVEFGLIDRRKQETIGNFVLEELGSNKKADANESKNARMLYTSSFFINGRDHTFRRNGLKGDFCNVFWQTG